MGIERIVVFAIRVAELAFAAVVAGVNGEFLHHSQGVDSWTIGRQIYAEVIAGISIFFALIWLVPFSSSMTNWPLDVVISLCWWAAFGLLVDQLDSSACGDVFNWSDLSLRGDPCGKFKTVIAFSFLSALLWLVSALVSLFWVHRQTRKVERTHRRSRWGRRSHV